MPAMFNRRQVFAAACLGMLLFGVVMTTLGAILTDVIQRFSVGAVEAGTLLSMMSIGILLGSVLFGPIVDRYGYKGLLLAGTALVLVGLQGLAFAPVFDGLRLSALLIGFGGGVLNGGTNALVADISEEGRSSGLSYLGIFFGLGAFGIPFAMGSLKAALTPTMIVALVGVLFVIPLIYFAVIRFPSPKHDQGFPIREGLRLTRDGVLILLGLMLFLQSGMEIMVGGWTTSFFTEVIALEAGTAVFYLSLFWAGIMLARIVLGNILKKMRPAVVLVGFIAVALAGALLLLASTGLTTAAPGIFLIGWGLAAGYPVILGFVADRYPRLSGTAFSIVLVIALVGGTVMPYLAGVIAEPYGMRMSFVLVPVCLVLQAGLLGIFLVSQSARHPVATSSAR
jgi:MFS transporter, FHS family, glucose/mannose:H+ symporter